MISTLLELRLIGANFCLSELPITVLDVTSSWREEENSYT